MEQNSTSSAIQRLVGPSIENGWFTPEETAAIIATSYKYDIGVFIRLALGTGISIHEIKGLRWDSLHYDPASDYEYYELTIGEVRYDLPVELALSPEEKPITGCYRRLCLPTRTGRELLQWYKLHSRSNTSYVLVDEDGELMDAYRFARKYAQLLRAAHVRPLTFDAMRTTFVFNALTAGLSTDVIALILGIQPSYELSEAHAEQIGQKFECGFPVSLIDVYPTLDYSPVDPEILYIREKNEMMFRQGY